MVIGQPVSVEAPQLGVIQIVKITEEYYTSVWMFYNGVINRSGNVVSSSEITSTRGGYIE